MSQILNRRMALQTFDEEDSRRAYADWGANCGPNALAFALGMTLDEIRPHMGDFEKKYYTNPMLMKACVVSAGARVSVSLPCVMRVPQIPKFVGLCRIQWAGPWTAPGSNPKWAYRQTHWVASYILAGAHCIFDCNGGARSFDDWKQTIAPLIVANIPRANGDWWPTHAWELEWQA